jgi:hypothetical protein
VWLKGSAATAAALLALFYGAGVAHASDTSPGATGAISANGGDGIIGDLLGGGDGEDDGALGDVLGDATGTIDDTLDGVGDVVDDAKSDVDETLSGVEDALDEVVPGAGSAVGGFVDGTTGKVDDLIGTAEDLVDATPAASPAGDVVKNVTSTVDGIVGGTQQKRGKPAAKGGSTVSNGGPAQLGRYAATASEQAPAESFARRRLTPPLETPGLTAMQRQDAYEGAPFAPGKPGAIQAASPGSVSLDAPTFFELGTASYAAPAASASPAAASSVASVPHAPLPPAGHAGTAVAAAGAAGAALTAALLCSILLLAPRTGRLARPGPILVRAEPCLSLPERPG